MPLHRAADDFRVFRPILNDQVKADGICDPPDLIEVLADQGPNLLVLAPYRAAYLLNRVAP